MRMKVNNDFIFFFLFRMTLRKKKHFYSMATGLYLASFFFFCGLLFLCWVLFLVYQWYARVIDTALITSEATAETSDVRLSLTSTQIARLPSFVFSQHPEDYAAMEKSPVQIQSFNSKRVLTLSFDKESFEAVDLLPLPENNSYYPRDGQGVSLLPLKEELNVRSYARTLTLWSLRVFLNSNAYQIQPFLFPQTTLSGTEPSSVVNDPYNLDASFSSPDRVNLFEFHQVGQFVFYISNHGRFLQELGVRLVWTRVGTQATPFYVRSSAALQQQRNLSLPRLFYNRYTLVPTLSLQTIGLEATNDERTDDLTSVYALPKLYMESYINGYESEGGYNVAVPRTIQEAEANKYLFMAFVNKVPLVQTASNNNKSQLYMTQVFEVRVQNAFMEGPLLVDDKWIVQTSNNTRALGQFSIGVAFPPDPLDVTNSVGVNAFSWRRLWDPNQDTNPENFTFNQFGVLTTYLLRNSTRYNETLYRLLPVGLSLRQASSTLTTPFANNVLIKNSGDDAADNLDPDSLFFVFFQQ